jgi:DNA-binding transcriptional LysR family regulator
MRAEEIDINQFGQWECVKRPYVPDVNIPNASRLRSTALAENMEGIALLVLSGRFIGFLPEHYAERWVELEQMRAVRPDHMYYDSHIELLVRSSAQSLGVRLFVEDLLAAFRCEAAKCEAPTQSTARFENTSRRARRPKLRPA